MVGYREPTIMVTSVEAALEGLKYTSKDVSAARSLYTLALVDAFLKDPSTPASPLMREHALRQILTDLIAKHYRSHNSATLFTGRPITSEADVYAMIQRDVQTDNPDHIGWSILYHLYVVTAPSLTQEMYAQHGAIVPKTVYRYKKTALKQLTHALIDAEWHMRRQRIRQRLLMRLPPSDGIPLVGRDEILKRIESTLERTPYPCIVLGGPPGCGKSALVREVARRLIDQERVTFLIWLDGPQSLADVDAQIQEQLRAARLKCSWDDLTASYPVLVVLDNSQALGGDWDEVLSVRLGRTITLVAGHTAHSTQRASLNMFMSDLGPEAAAELVRTLLYASSRDTTDYQSYARTIYQAVGGNPSAIRTIVGMLEEGDVAFFDKKVLGRVYDHLDAHLSEDTHCLWDVLMLFPEGMTAPQLQMLGFSEAAAMLLRHGILTGKSGGYTLSSSAQRYRAKYTHRGLNWMWAKIFADTEAEWGWAAASLLGHRHEELTAEDVTLLLKRYQHEMPLFPRRWRPALERWSSVLDGSLTLTYAACLLKLGDVKASQSMVQDVIRQAGQQGDFILQAEALLLHSSIGRHRGKYQEALRDLQRVKRVPHLPADLQQRLIEEELQIALDREDHAQMQRLLPHLIDASPASQLLRLEVLVALGHWADCERLADQLQRESPEDEAWVLTILGRSAHDSQQFAQAADYFQAALLRFEQQQDIRALSRTQMNLASSLLALDQRDDAKMLLETAAQSFQHIQDQIGLSAVQANLDYLSQLNRFKPL
jgi:tetratricopeptide (TPR) repeat protein